MVKIDRKVLSRPAKKKILTVLLHNFKKSAVTHSIEKPMLLNFVDLSTIFCPRLQEIHCFYKCPKYNKLSPPERFTFVESKTFCFKRLRRDHFTGNCKSKLTCS